MLIRREVADLHYFGVSSIMCVSRRPVTIKTIQNGVTYRWLSSVVTPFLFCQREVSKWQERATSEPRSSRSVCDYRQMKRRNLNGWPRLQADTLVRCCGFWCKRLNCQGTQTSNRRL